MKLFQSIFETQIHSLGLPVLPSEPPVLTSDITAADLMNKSVVVFPKLVSVDQIVNVLKAVAHQGFPVVEEHVVKVGRNVNVKEEIFCFVYCTSLSRFRKIAISKNRSVKFEVSFCAHNC